MELLIFVGLTKASFGGTITPSMYSAGNSYYKSYIADEYDCPGPAPFSLVTGPLHPWGDEQMITSYFVPGWPAPWWSYATFRDYSLSYEYILGYTAGDCCEYDIWGDCIDPNPLYYVQPTSGWTKRDGYSYYTTAGSSGSATYVTWQFDNFWVEQRIEAFGTDYEQSGIMLRYRIRNTSSSRRCYGLRVLLDINVASYDGAYFFDTTNGWRSDEEAWDQPVPFDYWIISEQYGGGSYAIYGSIRDTSWGMSPTEPEHFSYAYWGDQDEPWLNGLWHEAWTDCASQDRIVGGVDAAVAYWWGWTPLSRCLDPGQEDTLLQYFFSSLEPLYQGVGEQSDNLIVTNVINGSKPVLRFSKSGLPFRLYNSAGRAVVSGKTADAVALPRLKNGVYLLVVDDRVYRLVVR